MLPLEYSICQRDRNNSIGGYSELGSSWCCVKGTEVGMKRFTAVMMICDAVNHKYACIHTHRNSKICKGVT